MSTEWKGTPAEWDAEFKRIVDAATSGFSAADVALKLLPPRPVEPPSVVTAVGWRVTWDGAQFAGKHPGDLPRTFKSSHDAAFWASATEAEHDAIRALRDGPTARYEVCGWGVTHNGRTTTCGNEIQEIDLCEEWAHKRSRLCGGTAHAIYKRVGGAA